jgi:AAA+ ATPase superfamily predicted ATPase
MEVERHRKKFLRSPAGKLLYPVITLRPNLNNFGPYKTQIRWFKHLEYWFRNIGDNFLSNEYKELAKYLQKKLQSMAR